VFCSNVGDGKVVAIGNPNAKQVLGVDARTIKDTNSKPYGQELYDAYQKPDGQIIEVTYVWPRPGPDMLDGAPNHRCADLALPNNVSLLFLPPYARELNPTENLWDEIREKIFKNYTIKSIKAVYRKLEEAILYIKRNSELVKSITSFPYIVNSL
jgi:transposase